MEATLVGIGFFATVLAFMLFWYSLHREERSKSKELLSGRRFGGEQW